MCRAAAVGRPLKGNADSSVQPFGGLGLDTRTATSFAATSQLKDLRLDPRKGPAGTETSSFTSCIVELCVVVRVSFCGRVASSGRVLGTVAERLVVHFERFEAKLVS